MNPLESRTYSDHPQSEDVSDALTYFDSSESQGNILKVQVLHRKTGQSETKVLSPAIASRNGVLIGRNPQCDIVLNSPEVSRVHARIVYTEGHYYFTDMGSTSGSQINNQKTLTNQPMLLKVDDIIQIGKFILIVEGIKLSSQNPIPPKQQVPKPKPPVSNPAQIPAGQLRFKAEELNKLGILTKGVSELKFQGKRLIEIISLSKRFDEKALNLWQTELHSGRFCILIEHPTHFSIWAEKR
jgi:pSer/pThr/pTyr-binding forkhead associated (FHA) protein